jgi:hypothetical protein
MKEEKKTQPEKKGVNSIQKNEEGRKRQFETPSQQRNRDGLGREQNGSDGSMKTSISNNH